MNNIEKDIFNKYKVDIDKLIKYGFIKNKDEYIYEKNILNNKFKIVINYNKEISGKIFDLDLGEEYINFRRENLGEFSSNIKEKYIDLLNDIREKCFHKTTFIFDQTMRINSFIKEKYNSNPEFLWEKYPTFAVYKNNDGKWFSLIGSIAFNKIDKESNLNKETEFLNIKINESELDNLLNTDGIYEAYHMNKKKWVTIILNDTLSDEDIKKLIIDSYNNVKENK